MTTEFTEKHGNILQLLGARADGVIFLLAGNATGCSVIEQER
jgi:hypothetical protein